MLAALKNRQFSQRLKEFYILVEQSERLFE